MAFRLKPGKKYAEHIAINDVDIINELKGLKDSVADLKMPRYELPYDRWCEKLKNYYCHDCVECYEEKSNCITRQKFLHHIKNGFKICDLDNLVCDTNNTNYCLSKEEWITCIKNYKKFVSKKQIWGPFGDGIQPIPFDNYHVSPYFVKDESNELRRKLRMIVDFSFPKGGNSVNSNMRDDEKTLTYLQLHDIVLWLDSNDIKYIGTADAQDAYLLVPLDPRHVRYMGVAIFGLVLFFTSLMWGLGSACLIYHQFAGIVLWIICDSYNDLFYINNACLLHHYLDDFLFGHHTLELCNKQYDAVKDMFYYLGIPTQDCKMNAAARINIFIGFLFDLIRRGVSMPSTKLNKCRKRGKFLLDKSRHQRSVAIIYIQRFVGIARHVCRVYYWSIPCLRGLEELCASTADNSKKVVLNDYSVAGINSFLSDLDDETLNFISFRWLLANKFNYDVMISTDGTTLYGIGGLIDTGKDECYQLLFSALDFWPTAGRIPDIICNELIALVIGIVLWGDYFSGRVVRANCDNFAIVKCLRRRCACFARKDLNGIISFLCDVAKSKRFYIHFEWVRGIDNGNADCLSRHFDNRFFISHSNYKARNEEAKVIAKQCIDIFVSCAARMQSRYVNGIERAKKCYCYDKDADQKISICKRQPLYI